MLSRAILLAILLVADPTEVELARLHLQWVTAPLVVRDAYSTGYGHPPEPGGIVDLSCGWRPAPDVCLGLPARLGGVTGPTVQVLSYSGGRLCLRWPSGVEQCLSAPVIRPLVAMRHEREPGP